jgi:hypothetical protein
MKVYFAYTQVGHDRQFSYFNPSYYPQSLASTTGSLNVLRNLGIEKLQAQEITVLSVSKRSQFSCCLDFCSYTFVNE